MGMVNKQTVQQGQLMGGREKEKDKIVYCIYNRQQAKLIRLSLSLHSSLGSATATLPRTFLASDYRSSKRADGYLMTRIKINTDKTDINGKYIDLYMIIG